MDELFIVLQSMGNRTANPELVKEIMCLMFDGYNRRKRNGTLYAGLKDIPKSLIVMYWNLAEKQELNEIYSKFKRKYIINENDLENVHNRKERLGLREVYDFISDFDDGHWLNLYIILKLHALLYSKVDYPEFGGSFRTENCCIESSDVTTTPHELVPKEITALYSEFEELLKLGRSINERKAHDELINYVDAVIRLKCKLIKIHPFKDGNGRTCRALVNLMFKQVNLPPVYIQKREKEEYIRAMDSALRNQDYDLIEGFYYYKLCDSIIDLNFDISFDEATIAPKTIK
ncbi:MAG: Fic family protein [Firmicutes bacterium]|nr:Fic family protein [Bacillota bacterium]